MDAVALRDERGQAHAFAVLIAWIAAVTIAALIATQQRLLGDAHAVRAREAAAEAAGAEVSDAHFDLVHALRRTPEPGELAALLADPALAARALGAATALAAANGIEAPDRVVIVDAGRAIEVEAVWPAGRARVAVEKVTCCPH